MVKPNSRPNAPERAPSPNPNPSLGPVGVKPRAENAAVTPPFHNSADPLDCDVEDDCADAEDRAPLSPKVIS